MKKWGLLCLSGTLWGFASFKILSKGIPALIADHRWWVILLLLVLGTGFLMMFKKVSARYSLRIFNLEGDRFPFYKFMSLKGYLLIGFMMSMGIGISYIPGMPQAFFAFFYTALGTGLASGSIRFFVNAFRKRG